MKLSNHFLPMFQDRFWPYHACAELALDHREKAFADVRVIRRLSDGLKDENTLVALLIRVALQGVEGTVLEQKVSIHLHPA